MRCRRFKDDSGAVMLESVFGVLVAIIVLALLLSLGFYLYQHTVANIVVNEIAEDVVMTYRFKDVDDCADITVSKIKEVGRYRNLIFGNQYKNSNEAKGARISAKRITKTSLAQSRSQPKVEIVKVGDDLGRMHYEVTLTQKYEFMLGGILKLIGLKEVETISATAYVESADISVYVNTIKMANYGLSRFEEITPLVEMVNSVVGMMSSVYKLFT